MRSSPSLRAAAVALLTGVLLTACGTAGESPGSEATRQSPTQALTLASAKTSQAKTARLAFTVSTTGAGSQAETVTGTGVADFAANKLQITTSAGGEKIDMVLVGTTIYMKIAGKPLVAGKSWLKLDLKAMSKAAGTDLGNLAQGSSNDPTQGLAFLKGVSDDATEVGREQIRGVDTTHYKATIDLRKAVEQQSPEARKQLERLVDQAEVQSLPADAWIDDDGRVRKMQYQLKMRPKGSGQKGSAAVSTTMELFDFGTAVKVQAPPANQVADFSEVIRQMQSGSSNG